MSQIQDLAALAHSYRVAYEAGQLSPEDFKQLVEDLNLVGQIEANAEELEQNQQYYQILMGVVQLASIATSL